MFAKIYPMKATECYKEYLSAWREEIERQHRECERNLRRARGLASRLAKALVEGFSARRVYLTGSLREGHYHEGMDIDLLVEGLKPEIYFKALALVHGLAKDIDVDLIPLEEYRGKDRVADDGELLYEKKY
jgi:uncharacterized protein